MKFRILAVAAVLLLLAGISVSASSVTFDIDVDNSYLTAYKGENLSEIASVIGVTEAELAADFNKGGLLYLSVAPDNSVRIKLSAFADNFSVEAVDMAYLDGDNMKKLLSTLGGESGGGAELIESRGRKYAVISETVDGNYTVTQYITICGGKTYYLSCYNSGEEVSDSVRRIFESFTLVQKTEAGGSPVWLSAVIIFGIVVFAIIAVIMAVGIIRNIKFKEN